MAKKEERKKQKKRLKEQKQRAGFRQYQAKSLHRGKYPQIKVNQTGGDPTLVREVRRLLEGFSFQDPKCCPEEWRSDFADFAKHGFKGFLFFLEKKALKRIREEVTGSLPLEMMPDGFNLSSFKKEASRLHAVDHFCELENHVGNWVFDNLPKRFTQDCLARYFFATKLRGSDVYLGFNLLKTVGDPHNPLYLFPRQSKVVMQGVDWEVGLYRHAMEKLSDRLGQHVKPSYERFVEIESIFSYPGFSFTPVALSDGTEAVRIDRELDTSTDKRTDEFDFKYVREILGFPDTHVFPPSQVMSTVVGYLPVQIQGKYARAKTFLLPGFSKTPEGALVRSKAATETERAFLQSMSDEYRSFALGSDMMKALKWYHDNGVPQVFSRRKSGLVWKP